MHEAFNRSKIKLLGHSQVPLFGYTNLSSANKKQLKQSF